MTMTFTCTSCKTKIRAKSELSGKRVKCPKCGHVVRPQLATPKDDSPVTLSMYVPPPSYQLVLDWMKELPGRHVSFDMWARGNYVRRLIHTARDNSPPLIVPFRYVNEMRWAYRRLTLTGAPVDFLFMGRVTKPKKVLHLFPGDGNLGEVGGWGYTAALGSRASIQGRDWYPAIGHSRLMPEEVVDWISEEAPEAFCAGKVFVAPAELIGIDPNQAEPGTQALASVTRGCPLEASAKASATMMQLDLPFVDQMSAQDFRKFLADHEDELIRFRSAFKKLVAGVKEQNISAILDEIRSEVAELRGAERYTTVRRTITALGGVLATFGASVAAAVAGPADCALPVGAAAGVASAAGVLATLWKERYDTEAKRQESPFFLLWKLGIDKVSKVQHGNLNVRVEHRPKITAAPANLAPDLHWLCPPTGGLSFLAVKDA